MKIRSSICLSGQHFEIDFFSVSIFLSTSFRLRRFRLRSEKSDAILDLFGVRSKLLGAKFPNLLLKIVKKLLSKMYLYYNFLKHHIILNSFFKER